MSVFNKGDKVQLQGAYTEEWRRETKSKTTTNSAQPEDLHRKKSETKFHSFIQHESKLHKVGWLIIIIVCTFILVVQVSPNIILMSSF